ncbi:Glycoside hydrolase family 128 protein [Mycena venus]|uniref:Glycoside hydrolase family 128 protein n=1 Tax=Mycena venus TaxID=2733690 RepID=A0A8H7DI96_9AGAR|nr:Glycoside hydrolase family 128 protein [Mycena venus]
MATPPAGLVTVFLALLVSLPAASISFSPLKTRTYHKPKAGLAWYYTWGAKGYVNNASEIEFVPMLWGSEQIESFNETIQDSIQTLKITTVLGMNEPQEPSQANITAAEGAVMWKKYLEPLKARGIRLGSPAPSGSPTSKPWLQDFITECDGNCTVDFLALHWYNTNATAFKEFLCDFHHEFQRNIWVTEWACQNMNGPDNQCTLTEIIDFLRETQLFMDQTDWVERYAWYGAKRNLHGVNPNDAMVDPDGVINDLGRQYISEF